jgi:hypothetical protein
MYIFQMFWYVNYNKYISKYKINALSYDYLSPSLSYEDNR